MDDSYINRTGKNNKWNSSLAIIIRIIMLIAVFAVLMIQCNTEEKPEIKKEETKKEIAQTSDTLYGVNRLSFADQSANGKSGSGINDKFIINENAGYLDAILKTAYPIGVPAVDVRVVRESLDGYENIETQSFTVDPNKDYFYF